MCDLKTKNFIEKAQKIYGNKYNYSKVIYEHSQKNVIIICAIHGEFNQRPNNHLFNHGCKKCGIIHKSNERKSNTNIWIEKAKSIHGNKYNYSKSIYTHSENKVKIICSKHGEFEQLASNHLRGANCHKCGKINMTNKTKDSIESFVLKSIKIHGNKYDYSKVEYKHSQEKVKIICPDHGEFEQIPNSHLRGCGCSMCVNIISKAELEIIDWLKEINIVNIEHSNRKILNNKEIDIYLPDHNLAIEFNGIYWHSEDYKDDNYHLQKTEECLSKGITLIHIFEDEWLMKKNIVKSRIKNLLKLTKSNKTIYARNTFIKEIDSVQARKFLDNNHLQGFVGAKIHLGLFYKHNNNEYLVSYMSFGNLRKNLGQREINDSHYELLRFCNFIDYRVIGGASKLLKYFEKTYKPERIISYADRRWSTGNLYEQLKFTLSHKSKPNYFYLEGNKRHNRFGYRKDILISKYNCNPEMTEKEFCRDILGLTRIYDCGNLVYEKNTVTINT